MGWAHHYIEALKTGKQVSFRPRGNSMSPRIKSGQLCTVEPIEPSALQPGDVVLCRVKGSEYLHLVKAVSADGRLLIGNAKGHLNGWVNASGIFGRLVKVEV